MTPLDYAISLTLSLWGAVLRTTADHARAGIADAYGTLAEALGDPARVRVRAASLAARALGLALLAADALGGDDAAARDAAAEDVLAQLRWRVDGAPPADPRAELAAAWGAWVRCPASPQSVALAHAALRVCEAGVAPEDLARTIPWDVRGATVERVARTLGRERLVSHRARRAAAPTTGAA